MRPVVLDNSFFCEGTTSVKKVKAGSYTNKEWKNLTDEQREEVKRKKENTNIKKNLRKLSAKRYRLGGSVSRQRSLC